jgi:hypothetical protein
VPKLQPILTWFVDYVMFEDELEVVLSESRCPSQEGLATGKYIYLQMCE